MEPNGQKPLEPPVMETPMLDGQSVPTQVVEDVDGDKPEHTASDATLKVETQEVQKVPTVETPEVEKNDVDGDPPATPAPSGAKVGEEPKEESNASRKACPCFDSAL